MTLTSTENISGKFSGLAANEELSSADLAQKLKGYYLVRSYAKGADPYAVITDLPEDEALSVALKNDPQRGEDNYRQRVKTENWLRAQAQRSGVEMQKETPAYFALTNDPTFVLSHVPDHKDSMVIPLENIDLSSWTFTMDDHFFAEFSSGEKDCIGAPSHAKPHPLHGHVLNAAQLVQALKTYGLPDNPYENNIEAQMWAPEPQKLQTDISLGLSASASKKTAETSNEIPAASKSNFKR